MVDRVAQKFFDQAGSKGLLSLCCFVTVDEIAQAWTRIWFLLIRFIFLLVLAVTNFQFGGYSRLRFLLRDSIYILWWYVSRIASTVKLTTLLNRNYRLYATTYRVQYNNDMQSIFLTPGSVHRTRAPDIKMMWTDYKKICSFTRSAQLRGNFRTRSILTRFRYEFF